MTWFLNPKNMALVVLAALLVGVGAAGGIQYARVLKAEKTIVEQAAGIEALNMEKTGLLAQITDYKKNIAEMKAAAAEQQSINDSTAAFSAQLQDFTTEIIMEVPDEQILSDYTYYFNSHGMRRSAADHPTTGGKVLPGSGASGVDGPHWTVRQLAANYLQLIDYALKLEATVRCYEKE